MKVLLTGAGGFLGRHIMQALDKHTVTTMGRGSKVDIRADISSPLPDLHGYDLVVHAAGKAHTIPKREDEAIEFKRINHDGTSRLLEALTRGGNPPGTFVFISSVAVYGLEEGDLITESQPLSPVTPYAESKAMAEKDVESWAGPNGVSALILRLPLVVGKGAPGNLGAMERHLRRGTYLRIGKGTARRSMVMGTDVASLIARANRRSGTYNLTDGHHPSFKELDAHMASQIGARVVALPDSMARIMARAGDLIPGSPFNTYRYSKMSQTLTFDDSKAVEDLDWSPTPVLNCRFLV